ncbi:MAG: restriction endonuclease subunit S [Pseudonocardiaceae bacterium]
MSKYPLVPLGEVLTKSDDFVSIQPGEPYETAGILNRGRGLFKRPTVSGSETRYTKYNRLHAGQFVYSKLFAWEGALGIVTSEFDGLFVSHEFPIFDIVEERAISGYIAHLARWPDLHIALSKQTSGMGSRRQRVNIDQLLSTPVPLPDIEEQQRVTERLDTILNRADAVQELRASFSCLQGSLNESLVSRVSEEAVETAQLGDVLTFERTPIIIEADSAYRTIGVRSFGKGFIHHPLNKGEDLSKLNYFQFRAGTLALSNLMAWEGGITVTRQEDTLYVASNRFFFYLPTDDRVNVSFLRHFLLSRRGQALISSACSAGAERNRTLGRKRFESLEIPLPPRAEQDRVARILDAFAERVSKVHADPALDSLRPSILNAAFTGQL